MQTNGFTLWLTGMSGAGKSTLANYLGTRIRAIGRKNEILDHDDLGPVLSKELGNTKEERHVSMSRLGLVAKLLTRNDCIAIAAAVSPHREIRDRIRKDIGRFVEVFVDCTTEKLIERDTKGLYKKALAGDLPNFTGITEPYDTPQHAEVIVRTDAEPVEASAEKVVQALVSIGYLKPEEAKAMTGKRIKALPLGKSRAKAQARPKAAARSSKHRPAPKARMSKRAAPRKSAKRARRS